MRPIGLAVVLSLAAAFLAHAAWGQAGLPVHTEAVLRYLKVTIRAQGKRCDRISSARLWAIREGGTFTQVLCDSTGPKTGFWYGVYADENGKVTRVEAMRGPLL